MTDTTTTAAKTEVKSEAKAEAKDATATDAGSGTATGGFDVGRAQGIRPRRLRNPVTDAYRNNWDSIFRNKPTR